MQAAAGLFKGLKSDRSPVQWFFVLSPGVILDGSGSLQISSEVHVNNI
jgi:hypothetical protein